MFYEINNCHCYDHMELNVNYTISWVKNYQKVGDCSTVYYQLWYCLSSTIYYYPWLIIYYYFSRPVGFPFYFRESSVHQQNTQNQVCFHTDMNISQLLYYCCFSGIWKLDFWKVPFRVKIVKASVVSVDTDILFLSLFQWVWATVRKLE